MRSLFTVNVKTKEHGFDEFLIRKSENTLKAQYDANAKLMSGAIKRRFQPLIIISFIALMCGGFLTAFFLDEVSDADFAQVYSTMGWALYIGIAGIALFVIFFAAAIVWMRKFMAHPQTQNLLEEQTELRDKIARDLRVPKESAEIDVMGCPYKLKGGKPKYDYKSYENLPMWVFVENDNLCFADLLGVWAVPLSDITAIMPFPGHAPLTSWNKEEKFNSPTYKRMVRFYKGKYIVKGYYLLQFMRHGEEWEVSIPMYDADVICKLTGKYSAVSI